MRYRHYAPKGNLIVVDGEKEAVCEYINAQILEAAVTGKKVAVMASRETAGSYKNAKVYTIGSVNDEEEIARNLYDVLRQFDEEGMELIFSEAFETPHMGQAIMNRLLKAAGHQVVSL